MWRKILFLFMLIENKQGTTQRFLQICNHLGATAWRLKEYDRIEVFLQGFFEIACAWFNLGCDHKAVSKWRLLWGYRLLSNRDKIVDLVAWANAMPRGHHLDPQSDAGAADTKKLVLAGLLCIEWWKIMFTYQMSISHIHQAHVDNFM